MENLELLILFCLLFASFCHCFFALWKAGKDRKFQRAVRNSFELLEYERLRKEALVSQSAVEDISAALNSDNYLTADQVAVMLQVSKGTIYTWAGSSYIPALKIRGGSQKNVWRFSRRDVETWIAEQKQPVTAKDLFAKKENADESAGT